MLKFMEKWSPETKRKMTIIVIICAIVGAIVGYKFYDYSQNDPNFCVSCHIMQDSFKAWDMSSHKSINCHECHHLAPPELAGLMYSFLIKKPSKIPERHGKIIVGRHVCEKCHVHKNEKFATAPSIEKNAFHEKHAAQGECTQCHGYIIHQFAPEANICSKCHSDKKMVAMSSVPCLDCHTTKAKTIAGPDRDKCLACHGDDALRTKINAARKDISKTFKPDEAMVKAAVKITFNEKSPMQFPCGDCHKPHTIIKPDWNSCNTCHPDIKKKGKHGLHFGMGMNKCNTCHKPHTWEVQPDVLNSKQCTTCHPASKDPEKFVK